MPEEEKNFARILLATLVWVIFICIVVGGIFYVLLPLIQEAR